MKTTTILLLASLTGCSGLDLEVEPCDPAGPQSDKAACDDDDPSTADRCVEARPGPSCAHEPAECDGYDPPAVQKAQCDDGDPCTGERCAGTACVHAQIQNCTY